MTSELKLIKLVAILCLVALDMWSRRPRFYFKVLYYAVKIFMVSNKFGLLKSFGQFYFTMLFLPKIKIVWNILQIVYQSSIPEHNKTSGCVNS